MPKERITGHLNILQSWCQRARYKRADQTMKIKDIAPCGINCSLCLAYQREKNHCNGCNGSDAQKSKHCIVCRIRNCEEKNGNSKLLCIKCETYPCRRIKDLNKRYTTRYNVSIFANFESIKKRGIREFVNQEEEKWKCSNCGKLLCMHREKCLVCGYKSPMYLKEK